ncbi:hypothetical protein BH10PLA2_BH10PLA2_23220 [soil metagenome]
MNSQSLQIPRASFAVLARGTAGRARSARDTQQVKIAGCNDYADRAAEASGRRLIPCIKLNWGKVTFRTGTGSKKVEFQGASNRMWTDLSSSRNLEPPTMSEKSRKDQLLEMLQEDATDPFLNYGLAMEYVAAKEDDAAVKQFERLFLLAPDYVPAYLQAAQALVRLQRAAEARTVFEAGIATATRMGDTHAAEEMSGFLLNLG